MVLQDFSPSAQGVSGNCNNSRQRGLCLQSFVAAGEKSSRSLTDNLPSREVTLLKADRCHRGLPGAAAGPVTSLVSCGWQFPEETEAALKVQTVVPGRCIGALEEIVTVLGGRKRKKQAEVARA